MIFNINLINLSAKIIAEAFHNIAKKVLVSTFAKNALFAKIYQF